MQEIPDGIGMTRGHRSQLKLQQLHFDWIDTGMELKKLTYVIQMGGGRLYG